MAQDTTVTCLPTDFSTSDEWFVFANNPSSVPVKHVFLDSVTPGLDYAAQSLVNGVWTDVASDLFCFTNTLDDPDATQVESCHLGLNLELKGSESAFVKLTTSQAPAKERAALKDTIENDILALTFKEVIDNKVTFTHRSKKTGAETDIQFSL